jgi:phospholipase/lecithinase/hemolysin
VEALAQLQGLAFKPSNNISDFGNTSSYLVGEVNNFQPPQDASHALVVIWVNNADMYYPATENGPSLAKFNTVIDQAQANHYKAITNLYAKGIRTLVMPNVVDISTVPGFNKNPANQSLFHQASLNYNTAFYATLNRARANCPGLTIYVPDFFALLNNLLAQPASYGVNNALLNGVSIDALEALVNPSLTNGPATSYIFWDVQDPTAKVHYIMANVAQQLISPVQIGKLATLGDNNRLDLVNVPVGLNGVVEGCTNLAQANWTVVTNFNSIATAQSIFVVAPPLPADFGLGLTGGGGSGGPPTPGGGTVGTVTSTNVGPTSVAQIYRLHFPVAWQWP